MKKKLFQINNAVNFKAHRRAIENAFGADGAKAKDALLSLLDEMESSEVEYNSDDLKTEVEAIFAGLKDVPESVQNSITSIITKKVTEIQNAIGSNDPKVKLTPKVKNSIASAILRCAGKAEVENAVNRVLVENQITGLTFGDVIDYTIATKWENTTSLWNKLHKTKFTKFFYTNTAMAAKAVLAKEWDKTSKVEKTIQDLAVEGKSISTNYIYKRQQAEFQDLDEIELVGELSNFLNWVSMELEVQIVNSIIIAILIGDTINDAGERITTFESLRTKTATDAFTYVIATAGGWTVTKVREACDKIWNPDGKETVLCISKALLTSLSSYTYAAGGDVHYRSIEEMAGQFGVQTIFVTDIVGNDIVAFIPDGYWVNEKKVLSFVYPTYEKNRMNYQKEKNCGGAVHDLLSSVVVKYTAGT